MKFENIRQLSFRDPTSGVYLTDQGVYRKVNILNRSFYEDLFRKDFFKILEEDKFIQKSKILNNEDNLLIFHEKIDNFVEVNEMSSYQLFISGLHTLDIAIKSLENGYLLKDASAWNVVLTKGKPMFLDISSFEIWNKDKIWLAYGQFIRHFIIPLILNKELGLSIPKIFLTHRDGVQPNIAFKYLGIRLFKSFSYFEFIGLPNFFSSSKIKKREFKSQDINFSKKVLLSLLNRLKTKLLNLKPSNKSFWSNYTKNRNHYSDIDIKIKKGIVEDFLKLNKGKVLDIGCNTGEFLNLASKHCSEMHGIDFDENSINFIQENLAFKNISVSNVDISNPTPQVGWNNDETFGYIEKNKNFYDTIIFLGISHHLMVTDRIPLKNIILLLHVMTKKNLIFEFISKDDKKFIDISNINHDLYLDCTKENFEKTVVDYFYIKKIHSLDYNLNRHIYILEKK